jgi:hypothetical protein
MKAYKIMARNTRTGLRIQKQFLDGYLIRDYDQALLMATEFAQQQQLRSQDPWLAEVKLYTVGHKPGVYS